MPVGFSSTGFEAKLLTAIQAEIETATRAAISDTLNTSSTSLLGQYIGTTSSQLRQLWEAEQAIYTNQDVDQATGDALSNITKLTGTRRNAATASTVLMTIRVLAANSPYAIGTLVVHVVGDPTSRFANTAIVTTGVDATLTGVPFAATTLGPTRAYANTLMVIANPVTGFEISLPTYPTNPAEAVLGLLEETDVDLRIRHNAELARTGSSTVDAIRVDVLDYVLNLVPTAYVATFENDTDVTDVDGRPPHSAEAIVLGATDAQVAAAILLTKPAGIRAYGTGATAAISTVDTQGNTHSIGFTRPTVIPIWIDLTITAVTGQYAGNDTVKTAITDWCDANLSVGKDVIQTRIAALALGVAGVVDATCEIGPSAGAGTLDANFVIGPRQIASVDTLNTNVSGTDPIFITLNLVSAAP